MQGGEKFGRFRKVSEEKEGGKDERRDDGVYHTISPTAVQVGQNKAFRLLGGREG